MRDVRAQLYLDLMEYTQNVEALLDRLLNPDPLSPGREALDGLVHVEKLTARVELYIPRITPADEPALLGPAEV